MRASDHRPVYATFITEVHIIDHAKEESIRDALTREVLTREVGSAKGNRRPPPIPTTKKLEEADLDKSFKELRFDTEPGLAERRRGEETGVFREKRNRVAAKRKHILRVRRVTHAADVVLQQRYLPPGLQNPRLVQISKVTPFMPGVGYMFLTWSYLIVFVKDRLRRYHHRSKTGLSKCDII